MDADRRREPERLSRLAGPAAIVDVAADRDDRIDTALARACQNRLAIRVECAVVHVGVRVDHGEVLGLP